MIIQLRSERSGDRALISRIVRRAFWEAPHTGHNEVAVVLGLRQAGALSLSLLLEAEGQAVGYVAVSPVTLSDGSPGWYGIGPVAILPEWQRQGLGSTLMEKVLEALSSSSSLDARGVVLLGDPAFYTRFGFRPVPGLTLPGFPEAYFMARVLRGEIPSATVAYHAAFEAPEGSDPPEALDG